MYFLTICSRRGQGVSMSPEPTSGVPMCLHCYVQVVQWLRGVRNGMVLGSGASFPL